MTVKEIRIENNAMYQDDLCVRNCEFLSGRFLQKSQIYKYIAHSPDISIISVKLHFVQFWLLLRPGHVPIYQGRKEENPS